MIKSIVMENKINISRYIPFVLAVGLLSVQTKAQTVTSPAYKQTEVIKVENIKLDSQIFPLTADQKSVTREYVDGLGRSIQSVVQKASPLQKDLVQPAAYDQYGRQLYNYLPYVSASSDASYQANALPTAQPAFYANGLGDKVADDTKPYVKNEYENSPLQRLLKAGAVGDGFQPDQHYKSASYRTNTAADNIRLWKLDGTSTATYGAGSLSVTEYTNEDGNKSFTFKNKNGQLILKRIQADETVGGIAEPYFETYYIYDDAGNIKYVVPPKAVSQMRSSGTWTLSTSMLSDLVFSYVYDILGRVVEKKIPGKAVIYIIYDTLDRPILVQDGNLRTSNRWYYTKFDSKKRKISEGLYTNATYTTRTSMQGYINTLDFSTLYYEDRFAGAANGYSNQAFPTSGTEDLAYYFYDDYDLNNDGTRDYSYQSQSLAGEGVVSYQVRGYLTAIKKKILNTTTWLTSVSFYDKRGVAIQVLSNNQLNASLSDVKTIVPDFTGKVLQQKVAKTVSAVTTTVLSSYSYDHMNRVTAIDQSYNGALAVRVAGYEYNELGQLVKKKLHSTNPGLVLPANVTLGASSSVVNGATSNIQATNTITIADGFSAASGSNFSASITSGTYLQNVDYRYNIRGQMTSINNSTLTVDSKNDDTNDVFGMEILYDQKDAVLNNTSYYNGMVSAVKWMSKGPSSNERSYKFDYDKLYRFKNAIFGSRAPGAIPWSGLSGFDEKNITYDQNGNIMTLKRNAVLSNVMTEVDNLGYTYTGNRLDNVTDGTGGSYAAVGFRNLTGSGSPYLYNVNGDLTSDPKKGLSIDYNALGKTDKITITTSVGRYINYTYDVGGTLLKKQIFDNNVAGKSTDYIDGFVYENGTLAYFAMPEGRIRNTGSALKAEYMIKDHQGNVRVSFEEQAGVAVVRQENSYYPLGLIMPGSNIATPTSANKNLYNEGSEWQNDFGDLPDYYNTFFRNYDAALGRFIGIDPKAEASESFSTYQYANNNPLIFNDPLGDIAISQETLNFLEFIRSEGGKFGGVYSVSSNSDGLILGTMTYFTSHQDSMGEMNDYLSKNGYWGFTAAKDFKTAWDNFSARLATESNAAELGLREVTISAAKTNNNWLVDRQKEALAKAGLDGHTFYGAAVFFNDRMAKGNAVTLPGLGIFINPSDATDEDLLRHEFGHVLQSRLSGNSAFYLLYGLPSVISGLRQKSNSSYDHHLFWTEIDANIMSKETLKIERWNTDRFPLEVPVIEPIKIAPNDVYNTLFP
jgi:RHS repeat-associated protein